MLSGIIRKVARSKRGITLTELIVAMTLTSIFAVVCIALINPISNLYQKTVKLSRAQLLADSIVDGIRKECDGIKFDDKNSVWIADSTKRNEEDTNEKELLALNPQTLRASDSKGGDILIIQKNNNYAEAIYACVGISNKNKSEVTKLDADGQHGHAVDALFKAGGDNLQKGKVHFGYYKAKENDDGIYPFQAYDYTNPVLASTYGKYTVKLAFSNLTYKEYKNDEGEVTRKYPSYVECQIKVYDGDCSDSDVLFKGPIYTRSTIISFSANGSGVGKGGHVAPDKKTDIYVNVVWLNDKNQMIDWPNTVEHVNVSLYVKNILQRQFPLVKKTSVPKDKIGFHFTDVDIDGKVIVESEDLKSKGFDVSISGDENRGFVIKYKHSSEKTVKLVCGEYFASLLGRDTNIRKKIKHVVFGSKSQWADVVKNASGTTVAIPIDAPLDKNEPASRRKDDYMFYKVTGADGSVTVYVLSDDGTFVLNEDCTKMFQNCVEVQTITGISGPGTDTSIFDTSRVETMKSMFESCASIENFLMPNFVTSTCKSTFGMFKGCASVITYDFSGWDTSKVENMDYMFNYFHSVRKDGYGSDEPFELNISNLSFDSCTTMKYMFAADADQWAIQVTSHNLTRIVLPDSINTSKVTNMQGAFANNKHLVQIVNLNELDGDKITSCKGMFSNCQKLENVSMTGFVHSCCTSLEAMFENCYALQVARFTDWDTSGVTTIKGMFKNDSELVSVIGLNGRDFSKLTDCDSPFNGCTKLLDLNISGIKIPLIKTADNFKKLFVGSSIQNLDMSEAQLGLTTFEKLFHSNKQFETIDFSNVKTGNVSANNMFSFCTNLTSVNISCTNSDSFKLTDATQMFKGCTKLTSVNIEKLITSKCSNIEEMFYNCSVLPVISFKGSDFSGLNTMRDLCRGCKELKTLDLKTECVTSTNLINCQSIARLCEKLETVRISGLCVSSFQQSFEECHALKTLDLSDIDATQCTTLATMFSKCYVLEEFDFNCFKRGSDGVLNLSKVIAIRQMFNDCWSLKSVKHMTNINFSSILNEYTHVDFNSGNETIYKSLLEAFANCLVLNELDISGIQIPKIDNSGAFTSLFNKSSIQILKMPNATLGLSSVEGLFNKNASFSYIDFSNVVLASNKVSTKTMFKGCPNLVTVKVDSETSGSFKSTNAVEMFSGCDKLKTVSAKGLICSACKDMSNMFLNCHVLNKLDLNGCDTSGVLDMSYMCSGCSDLSFDSSGWSNWDTSNVTNMSYMFKDCCYDYSKSNDEALRTKVYTINISNFSFKSVTNMKYMFSCGSIKNEDYKYDILDTIIMPDGTNDNGNAPDVENIMYMFMWRYNTTEIRNLEHFNTGNNLKYARSMFSYVGCKVLDIRGLNFQNLANSDDGSSYIFDNCHFVETIYADPNKNYVPSKGGGFFSNCYVIKGGAGTTFISNDKKYAKIDGGTGNEGYFTDYHERTA